MFIFVGDIEENKRVGFFIETQCTQALKYLFFLSFSEHVVME